MPAPLVYSTRLLTPPCCPCISLRHCKRRYWQGQAPAAPEKLQRRAQGAVKQHKIISQAVSGHITPQDSSSHCQVLLTREAGKNDKLASALKSKGVSAYEMPLVYSADGPDRAALPEELKLVWSWIVLTSPEAAAVFLEAWAQVGRPGVKIAVVGQGTANILEAYPGFDNKLIGFLPSKADGKTLASTLPNEREGMTVLYPASAKASTDVQEILQARGFRCKMIRTYTTNTVKELTVEQQAAAAAAQVVTFASPSAIKAWVTHCGGLDMQTPVACIGKTTGDAAKKLGLRHVFHPENPGVTGFVDSIMDALAFQPQA